MNLLEQLRKSPGLQPVPADQLKWLLDNSTIRELDAGEFLFRRDDPADYMFVVFEGRAKVFTIQNNQQRDLFELVPGDISGLLPFSRLKVAQGFAQVVEPMKVLTTSREKLKELVCTHYELTEKLVHEMTSRVREFTSNQRQDEKMMALGKLSAGLAHELNNPAAAIVRSSQELKKHLGYTPGRFKRVIAMKLQPGQVDAVNDILYARVAEGRKNIGLRERNHLEEEILDWFDDNEVAGGEDLAENFVEYGIGTAELDEVKKHIPSAELEPVLQWLDNVLTTERMAGDIFEAANRISKLVSSIKSYSHMDRGHDRIKIDVHTGIRDTINLLAYKMRKANIAVKEELSQDLPQVFIQPGEMNQVWTNILDNAIDALDNTPEATIVVRSWKERNLVKVSVTDNGPGIPENLMSSIFDPFFTTKEVGKGSGLGLEIVQSIVKQHDGSVSVESKPGQTTFTVCLPIEHKA